LSITGISSCKSHTVHKLEWSLCTGTVCDLQLDIPVIDKGILPVHRHHSSLCTVCDHKLEWCLCTGSIPLSITGISSCKSHTVHGFYIQRNTKRTSLKS
jgi:hypothetical protein